MKAQSKTNQMLVALVAPMHRHCYRACTHQVYQSKACRTRIRIPRHARIGMGCLDLEAPLQSIHSGEIMANCYRAFL
jgi:hypothetical protein